MTRRAIPLASATAAAALAFSLHASASDILASPYDPDAIDRTAKAALEEGQYAFCKNPDRPLGQRQQNLCSLASEIDDCEGLAKACDAARLPKDRDWLERLAEWSGPLAKVLLFVLVLGIAVVIAIPVVRALAKLRRTRKVERDTAPDENRAVVVDDAASAVPEISDAETALRLADEHRARGDLERALGLYLAASLAALDRRGAIRVARHRTNGEYVRACAEEAARPQLREIVREVDKVEFGGAPPTDDGVLRVAQRAQAIVRAAGVLIVTVMLCAACSPGRRGADPAGDELPREVLRRSGLTVEPLGSSLSTMPIPEGDDGGHVVIVDVERVPLEDEAQAHMMRWVEAGGVLVLFGHAHAWPSDLAATSEPAETRDLVVRAPDPSDDPEDVDPDDLPAGAPLEITGARTARADAFAWKDQTGADAIAFLGERTYASKRRVGKGLVLGVANDDLFTNVGVFPRRNAAALVTIIRAATGDVAARLAPTADGQPAPAQVRVARAEDGVPPPGSPFAALVAAGLGKGAWHALGAALLLFFAYGIRHARARPAEKPARRAFVEHVEATGAFYGRARAHTHALGAYGRFMDLRLRELLPRGADPVAFLASRSGVEPARVAELYARALQAKAGDTPRGDERDVIDELRRIMQRSVSAEEQR